MGETWPQSVVLNLAHRSFWGFVRIQNTTLMSDSFHLTFCRLQLRLPSGPFNVAIRMRQNRLVVLKGESSATKRVSRRTQMALAAGWEGRRGVWAWESRLWYLTCIVATFAQVQLISSSRTGILPDVLGQACSPAHRAAQLRAFQSQDNAAVAQFASLIAHRAISELGRTVIAKVI